MNKTMQKFSEEDIEKAKAFSEKVVKETYNRFNKDVLTRKERIFMGKLGEIIFLKFLNSKNIFPNTDEMFEIYEGESNVDSFDFITKEGKKIDVKTAYKEEHKRILIPFDQFERGKAKDFYVGIKIDLNAKTSLIYGYVSKEDLLNNEKINFGEGVAYWEYLDKLKDLNELLTKIK